MTYALVIWITFLGTPVAQAVLARDLTISECTYLARAFPRSQCVPELQV
jgi:hypothetical protein